MTGCDDLLSIEGWEHPAPRPRNPASSPRLATITDEAPLVIARVAQTSTSTRRTQRQPYEMITTRSHRGDTMAQDETKLALRGLVVRSLLGRRRDFTFELNPDQPTILTGSNGTGKSTILRMIEAVGTGDWNHLLRLPFDELRLRFDRPPALRISRTSEGLRASSGKHPVWEYAGRSRYRMTASEARLLHDYQRRHAVAHFNEDLALELLREQELLRRHVSERIEPPDWLNDVTTAFSVLYITDQRLVINEGPRRPDLPIGTEQLTTRAAVDVAAESLARVMSQEIGRYAAESQRLDRDFPRRVVDAMTSDEEIPDQQLDALLREVALERERLQHVALLPEDAGSVPLGDLALQERGIKSVIWTVTEDTLRKLRVLEPLRVRLAMFLDFLNQHYRDKIVVMDQEAGFRLLVEASDQAELKPSQLSSGEQQILVLAHQVLFSAAPGTLILIDEPELSLHVLWQDSFVEDLTRMGKLRGLQFLLATHSPTLIGARADLTRSLD
jgi:ABC-type lipoprotein export system ATPase subunit